MELHSYKVGDYQAFGRRPRWIANAISVSYELVQASNHSNSYRIDFSRGKKIIGTLFGKQLLRSTGPSAAYGHFNDPDSLFTREPKNTNRIINEVGDFVPKIVASNPHDLILLFEYLNGKSDYTKLLESVKAQDEDERIRLIYDGARKVASIDGRLRAHQELFERERGVSSVRELSAELLGHLIRIKGYDNRKEINGGSDNPAPEKVQRYVESKYGIADLSETIEKLIQKGDAWQDYAVQHRDCRVKHFIGDKVVDIGSIGLDRRGRDLATYLSVEGGLATILVNKLPELLSYYLAYESAYFQPKEARKKILRELDVKSKEDVGKTVSTDELIRFNTRFLRMTIEEDLHLDATYKRSSPEMRKKIVEEIPGYTVERLLTARSQHIEEVFNSIASNDLFLELFPEKKEARDYFSSFAELLLKLEIIKLDSAVLAKIRG